MQSKAAPQSSVSPIDQLTTAKNNVTATQGIAQNLLNIAGATNFTGIGTATVIKTSAGRMARLSVVTAGTTVGMIYDATSTADLSRPLAAMLNTQGVYEIGLPFNFGLMVVPGAGQVVSGGYS